MIPLPIATAILVVRTAVSVSVNTVVNIHLCPYYPTSTLSHRHLRAKAVAVPTRFVAIGIRAVTSWVQKPSAPGPFGARAAYESVDDGVPRGTRPRRLPRSRTFSFEVVDIAPLSVSRPVPRSLVMLANLIPMVEMVPL